MKALIYLLGAGVVSFVVFLLPTANFAYNGVAEEVVSEPLIPTPIPVITPVVTPEPTFTPTPTQVPIPTPIPVPDPCRTITVKVTAYSLRTLTFTETHPDIGTIAVDPRVIPLGSGIFVPGYGFGLALDTGGGVIGNHIDIWLPSIKEALNWGVKKLDVKVCPRALSIKRGLIIFV